jgi:hypothetical protein
VGGTHADLALVVEELGRAATWLPIGQFALACRVLEDAGLSAETAARLAGGEALVLPAQPAAGDE